MTASPVTGAVRLLAAQATALGFAAAMTVIPANAIFLDAYGARWLPLSYIGIAVVGTAMSSVIARALRRWALPAVSIGVLASLAAIIATTWALIAFAGLAWPSLVQLVLFPVIIQLGFVVVGGQAGRLLDLQLIKAKFPRIVAGFAVGFAVGGFAAAPLLVVLPAPEDLAALASLGLVVMLGLVVVTARRRAGELGQAVGGDPTARLPLRVVLTARLVVVVFAYQVLSAMGSQVLDYLVFDRAAARYTDAADLSRFVALYTGVLNAVDITFLALVAGWLLRRFGLRLGLAANPTVVTLLAVGMVGAALGAGAASLMLFAFVVSARVADIALTDGTTRSSINAVYQVLPVEERLPIQATVEGVGVPVAIGATGVLLLVIGALGYGVTVIACVALVLCGAWSVAAFVVYAQYRRSLADRLVRRGLDLDAARPVDADEQTAARQLLLTGEVRDVRLGLDLADEAGVAAADLTVLAQGADPEVRLLALGQLAARGDETAARAAAADVVVLAGAAAPGERRAAALALRAVRPHERVDLLRALLTDDDTTVREAALGSVGADDAALVDDVSAALDDASTAEAALEALARLGPPVLALAADRLARPGPTSARDRRLVQCASASPAVAERLLAPLVAHPDREVSTAVLHGLARNGGEADPQVMASLLVADAALTARALAARATLGVGDEALVRALDDELAQVRERTLAVLALGHGQVIHTAVAALASSDPGRRALGIELLEISLAGDTAAVAVPVLRDDRPVAERLRALGAAKLPARDRAGWLADLVLDPDGVWASPWLSAVALVVEAGTQPDLARAHAGALGATDDPVLAETVRAVTAAPA